jgi:hypothetical protein
MPGGAPDESDSQSQDFGMICGELFAPVFLCSDTVIMGKQISSVEVHD